MAHQAEPPAPTGEGSQAAADLIQDMLKVKRYLRRYRHARRMRLIGPNGGRRDQPGPGHDGHHARTHLPAGLDRNHQPVGNARLRGGISAKAVGIGVSTSVGIGGNPINGSSFLGHLKLFELDNQTEAVVMVDEIGGPQEAQAGPVRPGPHAQTGGGLHRGPHRPQGS